MSEGTSWAGWRWSGAQAHWGPPVDFGVQRDPRRWGAGRSAEPFGELVPAGSGTRPQSFIPHPEIEGRRTRLLQSPSGSSAFRGLILALANSGPAPPPALRPLRRSPGAPGRLRARGAAGWELLPGGEWNPGLASGRPFSLHLCPLRPGRGVPARLHPLPWLTPWRSPGTRGVPGSRAARRAVSRWPGSRWPGAPPGWPGLGFGNCVHLGPRRAELSGRETPSSRH